MKLKFLLVGIFLPLFLVAIAVAEGINSGAVIGGVEGIFNSSGAPSWVLPGFTANNSLDCKFSSGQYWPSSTACTLSVTRATSGYANFANGNWQGFAPGVARITNLGLKVEEARTNSVRNSTMAGAAVGTARTISGITALSRTGSASAVLLCTTCNAAANDTITVSGASVSTYNGSWVVTAATANTSITFTTATNTTDSATGESVSAVSPGSLPTNWAYGGVPTGVAATVNSIGTENGVNTISISLNGTNASGSSAFIVVFTEGTTTIAATQGEAWGLSGFLETSGTAQLNWGLRVIEYSSGGSFLTQSSNIGVSQPATFTRLNGVYTTVNASIAYVAHQYSASILTANSAIAQTLLIGWPQLEAGTSVTTPIPTSSVAVTRNGDFVTLTTSPTFGASYTLFGTATPDHPSGSGSNQMVLFAGAVGESANLFKNNTGTMALNLTGGSGGNTIPSATWSTSSLGKLAGSVIAGSQVASFNTVSNTGSLATLPTTPNAVHIGTDGANASAFDGFICRIAINPTQNLSATQLNTDTAGSSC